MDDGAEEVERREAEKVRAFPPAEAAPGGSEDAAAASAEGELEGLLALEAVDGDEHNPFLLRCGRRRRLLCRVALQVDGRVEDSRQLR